MNIYDFDKTIYAKDSTIEFYKYCLKKYPRVKRCFFKQIAAFFFYIINLYSKKKFKENFFTFLKYVPEIDNIVNEFWNLEEKNIYDWYMEIKNEEDVIISASPEFLIKPVAKKLGISNVIATEIDKVNGKFLSENCYGEEKVKRLKADKELSCKTIENFYSDSYSDKPLAELAQFSYLIKNGKIEEWPEKQPKKKDILELIRYGFWGGISTALNLVLFTGFIYIGIPYLVSNVSSYFIAVLFSYFFNKKYVYKKTEQNMNESIWQILKYFMIRFLSIFVDSSMLWICVDIFTWNILLSKCVVSVFIIFSTYIINKLFVFKK